MAWSVWRNNSLTTPEQELGSATVLRLSPYKHSMKIMITKDFCQWVASHVVEHAVSACASTELRRRNFSWEGRFENKDLNKVKSKIHVESSGCELILNQLSHKTSKMQKYRHIIVKKKKRHFGGGASLDAEPQPEAPPPGGRQAVNNNCDARSDRNPNFVQFCIRLENAESKHESWITLVCDVVSTRNRWLSLPVVFLHQVGNSGHSVPKRKFFRGKKQIPDFVFRQ
jgi:hypothetical protein